MNLRRVRDPAFTKAGDPSYGQTQTYGIPRGSRGPIPRLSGIQPGRPLCRPVLRRESSSPPSTPSPLELFERRYGAAPPDLSPQQPSAVPPMDSSLNPAQGWPPYRELYPNAPTPEATSLVKKPHLDCVEAHPVSLRGNHDWLTPNLPLCGAQEESPDALLRLRADRRPVLIL